MFTKTIGNCLQNDFGTHREFSAYFVDYRVCDLELPPAGIYPNYSKAGFLEKVQCGKILHVSPDVIGEKPSLNACFPGVIGKWRTGELVESLTVCSRNEFHVVRNVHVARQEDQSANIVFLDEFD